MSGRFHALFSLALIGALGLSAPALPQEVAVPCALCGGDRPMKEDEPATPVRLDIEATLDFDRLIIGGTGDGSAELGPDGARNIAGSVTAIGARAMVGEVVIRGEPGRLVRIELPRQIELFGRSGGRIRLESIRADLPPMPRLDGNGRLSFRFGGVLRVSGDVDGEYRGDVPIDVDYF